MATTFRERVHTVIYMVVATFFFSSAVTGTHLATRHVVERNEELFVQRAVLEAAHIPHPATPEELRAVFDSRLDPVRDSDDTLQYWTVLSATNGEVEGVVVPTRGAGLWGPIEAVVGLSLDGRTLTGIDIIRQNETPGLGGRITESWFRDQFRGKHGPFSTVPEGTQSRDDEFDAITGATFTTVAIRDMLNQLLEGTLPMILDQSKDGS